VVNVQAENIGFAIPVDRVREVLEDQLLDPEAASSFLGFDVGRDDRLVVDDVLPGGPAQLAGLRPGDRVLRIQDQPLRNHEQYRLTRVCIAPSEEIEILVERAGRQHTVRVRPWDKIDGILYKTLGLTVEPYIVGSSGFVKVARLRENGPGDELGLLAGDLLYAAATRQARGKVQSRAWLASLASRLEPGEEIELELYRDLDGDGQFDRSELHRGTLVRE
jgi:S1-C subfamily serine protease